MAKPPIYTKVRGLFTLGNHILWIFGKKFIQFDTFSIDEDTGPSSKI
jgi:hypothetical protein